MLLSDLETLVAAMRKRSNERGIADPNVEFFDAEESSLMMVNYTIRSDVADEIQQHEVVVSGDAANRGDFAIPLHFPN